MSDVTNYVFGNRLNRSPRRFKVIHYYFLGKGESLFIRGMIKK